MSFKRILNEWKPSNYDDLPNVIKLFHGTDTYAMNEIVESGVISASKGRQHGETNGINWFSTELTGNFGNGTYFSIEVPKSDFDKYIFKFMNNGEVTSLISDIPIDKYNMKIERLNHVPTSRIIDVYKKYNGDIWEMQDETIGWDDEGTFQLMTPAYRYIIEKEFGKKAMRDFYNFMNESKIKRGKKYVRQGIIPYGDGETMMMSESTIDEVDADEVNLSSFETQDELNPRFWINGKINSRVRLRLLDLADDFWDSMNIKWVKPKDIVLTGSIANYNWSKYSDVDVHIIIDYKDIWQNTDFVEDYFSTKKELWLQDHDQLKIYGFPVEMYVEDSNVGSFSSGVYSLEKNEWLVEPNDFQDAKLNEGYIKKISAKVMTFIDKVSEKIDNEKDTHKLSVLSAKVKNLFDKLHKQRQESLEKHGEMGTYNIVWKVLRRAEYLDKMWEIINTVYDRVNSIK